MSENPRLLFVAAPKREGKPLVPQLVAASYMRADGYSVAFYDGVDNPASHGEMVAYFPHVEFACLAKVAPKAILGDLTAEGAAALGKEIHDLLPGVIAERETKMFRSRNQELEKEVNQLREDLRVEKEKSEALAHAAKPKRRTNIVKGKS